MGLVKVCRISHVVRILALSKSQPHFLPNYIFSPLYGSPFSLLSASYVAEIPRFFCKASLIAFVGWQRHVQQPFERTREQHMPAA